MYEFVKDTVEVVSKEDDEIWGECTKIKIKETGEELLVFEKDDRIEINAKHGGSLKRVGMIGIRRWCFRLKCRRNSWSAVSFPAKR